MGALYDLVRQIEASIHHKGLPFYKTKGIIGLEAGFLLGLVGPDSADEVEKIERLRAAAARVLGERF